MISIMILWNISPAYFFDKLQKSGKVQAKIGLVDLHHRDSYRWMAEQMELRIGGRPRPSSLPLWGWYQADSVRKRKPDLRQNAYLAKGTRGVRLEIELDDHEVLLSDFELWHYVLNYWYLPRSQSDAINFEKRLTSKGLSFYKTKPLPSPWHEKIAASWNRIFDLNWHDKACHIALPMKEKAIQASFWEIRMTSVRNVEYFVAR